MSHKTFFEPSGHLNEYGVSLSVDALRLERFDALPKNISSHLEACDECKQQVMQIIDQMKDQLVDTAAPHPFLETVQTQPVAWFRAAAIFLVVLTGGMLLYLSQSQRTEKHPEYSQHVNAAESTSSPATVPPSTDPQQLFADNFIPSPNLDNVITSEFRSTSIEVVSPDIGEFVKAPITFRWKNIGRPVKLKILTNKEIVLLTSEVPTNVFITQKKFEPGLYYWKLEEHDELLFIGKFFIR